MLRNKHFSFTKKKFKTHIRQQNCSRIWLVKSARKGDHIIN